MKVNKIDAIPDLSENQVIVFTEWMGRSPQIMEDQVTYPLVTNLQGLPQVKYVRGSSMFGMSFVYVIFNDDTDIYWARERVLERLNYASRLLPEGVTTNTRSGRNGSGTYFVVHTGSARNGSGRTTCNAGLVRQVCSSKFTGCQRDRILRWISETIPVTLNPNKLAYYGLVDTGSDSGGASNNNEAGGSKFEMNDIGYIIKTTGYLKSIEEIENIPLKTVNTTPISFVMLLLFK